MTAGRRRAVTVVAAGLAALVAPAPSAPAATVTMSGGPTTVALVADLAWFYRHDVERPPRFSIVGGGSDAGIADASRGIVDIGLSTRGRLATDPANVRFTPLAASGVCIVTNVANALPGLTRPQLQELVAGRAVSWSQIAGSPRTDAVRSAGGEIGTGSRSVFLATFVDAATVPAEPERTFATAPQIRDYVRANDAAWGYVDLAFSAGLHVVPFDGIPCARATVADKTYPGRRELSFVTRGAPRGAAARFIRWVRASRVARRVITIRYVPVGRSTSTSSAAWSLNPSSRQSWW